NRIRIADVSTNHLDTAPFQLIGAWRRPGQNSWLQSLGEQSLNQRTAYEAGASSNGHPHDDPSGLRSILMDRGSCYPVLPPGGDYGVVRGSDRCSVPADLLRPCTLQLRAVFPGGPEPAPRSARLPSTGQLLEANPGPRPGCVRKLRKLLPPG